MINTAAKQAGRQDGAVRMVAWVALCAMVALLAGAVVFWQERMLFIDAPFIAFRIINYGTLQVQEHRYGSAITQVVPLIASKMHWPLRSVLLAYSLSFNLLYLLVFCLLYGPLKSPKYAILLALYYTLLCSQSYYWTNNEVHQGIALLLLFFGWIQYYGARQRKPLLVLAVGAALLFLAIFTHPLVLVPAVFLWAFFCADARYRNAIGLPVIAAVSVLMVVISISKMKISNGGGGYDTMKLNNVLHLTLKTIASAFTNGLSKGFLQATISHLYLWPVVFVASLLSLMLQKRRLQAVLFSGASLGYYLLLCLTFDNYLTFYAESEWMAFTLIIAAPAVMYGIEKVSPKAALAAALLVFGIRLTDIALSSGPFVKHHQLVQALVRQADKNKDRRVVFIKKDAQLEAAMIMTWALPVETMMQSKLNNEPTQATLIEIDSTDWRRHKPWRDSVLTPWDAISAHDLNPYYFKTDPASPYTETDFHTFMAGWKD